MIISQINKFILIKNIIYFEFPLQTIFYKQKTEYFMATKKPAKAQQDQSTLKIPNCFRKKCEANSVVPCKGLKEKIDDAIENGKLEILQMWGQIGPICMRSFMDCLSDLNYQHLKKIRIWKADLQDEGVRSICNYIEKCNTIEYLDLMENNISELGCQFLAKVLMNPANKIVKLRLDNNKIGLKGMSILANGLRQNDRLEKLSLCYCNIPTEGVKYIQQILANLESKLRTLKLQGNPLMNEGFYEVVRAVNSCGDKLEKLNLADTGLNIIEVPLTLESLQKNIVDQLVQLLENNKQIAKYSFKNNYISDEIAQKMLDKVKLNKTIFIIDMPECISFELKSGYAEAMKKRKPKKKAKKNSKTNKKK